MEIKKDKVIMEFNEYIELTKRINDLSDRSDEYSNEIYKLHDLLITYKYEFKHLNRKLRDEKRKFYRNRRIFERFIDDVLSIYDEDRLKQTLNITCKSLKEKIMKMYDEDIKYN